VPTEQSPSSENGAWSSAVGHASTGKSGRVIERLQGDIDKLHREKQLLKMRHDEMEKANENLNARNQYLQDRNSNHEQSHEASLRQLARKERQLEDMRDELKREKERTQRAEDQARLASTTEEEWRDMASHAKAIAQQKESEYDAIVSCRNMDNDRHQNGLDKIKSSFETLLRQREEDVEKQRKLEIIAEQQRQTIVQLEELTKKLSSNFKMYRSEIDTAVADLRNGAGTNLTAMESKLEEMSATTGRMRWVMNIDGLFNGNPRANQPFPPALDTTAGSKTSIDETSLSNPPSKSPTRSKTKLLKKNTKSGR
jgi:chromosome segregation ATPase